MTVIKVENVSKRYRIGVQEKSDTFAGQLKNAITYPVRNFKRITQLKKFDNENDPSVFWALKDINFEVKQGEVLGIIGRNGAGKSTLLKVLSRITEPTTGSIKIKGRVSSLLEVGTGFHPELTGRDNVYMNGTILGMTKKEIDKKFDEIVAFSGVEQHIDTPVKFYSSGMKVRLGFSVAAHLEPEILIIDEVLAVGDFEFQKRCLGKMDEVAKSGRTVIFVSHNMAAVKSLCTKGIVLDKGKVVFDGNTNDAIDYYLQSNQYDAYVGHYVNETVGESGFVSLALLDKDNAIRTEFGFDETIALKIKVKVAELHMNAHLGFRVVDRDERIIFTSEIKLKDEINEAGVYQFVVKLPEKFLAPNKFKLTFAIHHPNVEVIEFLEECLSFEIVETGSDFHIYGGADYGCVIIDSKWILIE